MFQIRTDQDYLVLTSEAFQNIGFGDHQADRYRQPRVKRGQPLQHVDKRGGVRLRVQIGLQYLGIEKEQDAVELYSTLERNADDEELKKLFQFLIQQEKAHKLKLESEYEKHVLEDD